MPLRSLLVACAIVLSSFFMAGLAPSDDGNPTTQPESTPTRVTRFRAVLESPGGELPFGLDILQFEDGHTEADIRNGSETVRIRDVTYSQEKMHIDIGHYDAYLDATIEDADRRTGTVPLKFNGQWRKRVDAAKWSQLPFSAVEDVPYRFRPGPRIENELEKSPPISGRWTVRFEKSKDPAIGIFRKADDGGIEGTFLTTTGDYRYLAGDYESGRLRLSSFDGAHALLFDSRLDDDGNLKGDFWSRDVWHESWTAERDDSCELPNGFEMATPRRNVDLGTVRYATLDGEMTSLDCEAWRGRPRVIEVFGSWCPNCHDAAAMLNELHDRYATSGLVVVGIAFESTGLPARDARQVRRFVERNSVRYPVLLGGKRPTESTVEAFPLIDRIRAYPTTVFVDCDGRVVACYTGHSGPATGAAHLRLKAAFFEQVEALFSGRSDGASSKNSDPKKAGKGEPTIDRDAKNG